MVRFFLFFGPFTMALPDSSFSRPVDLVTEILMPDKYPLSDAVDSGEWKLPLGSCASL